MMKKALLAITLILLSAPCFSAGKLSLKDAWVREAPPMARNLAGYAQVRNIGSDTLTIVSISSPMFEKIEMHVTTFKEGMMRMEEVKTLKLSIGESVDFEPGGKHFMLIKPKQRIVAGLMVPIKVKLASGDAISFELEVRK